MQLPVSTRLTSGESDDRAKRAGCYYDYEVPVPEDPFSFRLEIHKALNYLQVPSIDWSDSGYVQHSST